MRKEMDPLYSVFEQHLFTALVEDETTEEFLQRVVVDYVARLLAGGTTIPQNFRESMEADIREEVLEMLRKNTYGHLTLRSYREAKGVEMSSLLHDGTVFGKEKARRSNGRAS